MGASLSLLAPQAHTVAISSYVDVLPNYKFLDVINDSRFLKTIKAYDASSGMLIVIKVFIKPPLVGIRLHEITEKLGKESLILAQYPNVLPWHRIIDTDLAGYLVRQLVRTNLYDRLSLRPFLVPVEKLWLVYQLLRTVELLHSELHIRHGDIKTENLLVTSANWLVLTDFSHHTKPAFLPDDNPSEFVFYFDSSDRRSCYVAPERFQKKGGPGTITDSMDMFSVGCVIAELYMDGEPTFTLSDLYRYKRGDFEPKYAGITDPVIRSMVKSLLAIDPETRPLAVELLHELCFPEYFGSFLYDFMTEMSTSNLFIVPEGNDNLSPSDLRVEKIYESFDKIVGALGFEYMPSNDVKNQTGKEFPAVRLNLKGLPSDYRILPSSAFRGEQSEQGALIVLDLLCSLLNTLKRPASKVHACELIVAISERISDEAKLDRALPYLCSLIDEYIEDASLYVGDHAIADSENFPSNAGFSTRVACVALVSITTLLESCSSINAINALIFPEYLSPKLKNIAFLNSPFKDETNHIRATLAQCLPYLAKTAERFCFLSRNFQADNGEDTHSTFAIPKSRLESDFKDLAEALLTDPVVNVRIGLVNNILPLCQFFGVDKTNDIILPLLVTYLNDQNYQLRLAFLESIIDIAPFIGALAFEQYLLPLLLQTLGDHEQLLVLKVLEVFHYILEEKVINLAADFNVLSIYKVLLTNSITLLLQPNEWVRQSVLSLVLVISASLLNADKFCFLYPLIKSYLSYDISVMDWDTLYPCITRPLSKQVYETALTWSSSATNKSLFWKQTKFSAVNQNDGKRKLVSFSKDMGKSVYLPQSNSSGDLNGNAKATSDIPMSPEDRQWILKLKSVGMDDKDLWKVFALKEHFINHNRSKLKTPSSDKTEFELASMVNVPPMNIFFEVCYKTEPISSSTKITESSFDPPINEALSIRSRRESNSLILAGAVKARASLQTVEANVLGELELSHENVDRHHHHHVHLTNRESNVTHKMFSVNNQKVISTTMRHNFTGANPYILKYLQNMNFDPTLEDFPEFGSVIKSSREAGSQSNIPMSIQGTLVARINANSNANSLEAITKIAVCPTSEYFITGSEIGNLKVWDTSKLDKNITGKSASVSINLKHGITDIVFMPHRFVFATATTDGHIKVFRVHVARGKNKKITKYSKLALLRSVKMDAEYARSLQFVDTAHKTLCVAVTSTCKVVAYDVITMEKEFELQNPPQYGVPSTFIVSKSCSWLLLGTSEGVMCLWDIRFQVLLKAWRVTIDRVGSLKAEIRQLMVISSPEKKPGTVSFAMIGGGTEPDITVWEVPSFECKQVYTANETSPRLKQYALQELENKEMSVEDIFAEFSIDLDQETNKSNTALTHVQRGGVNPHNNGYFVSATEDNRIIIWDLEDISKSVLLLTSEAVNFTQNRISLNYSVAFEKVVSGTQKKTKSHHDAITGLAVVTKPYYMLVAVERNGCISVYK